MKGVTCMRKTYSKDFRPGIERMKTGKKFVVVYPKPGIMFGYIYKLTTVSRIKQYPKCVIYLKALLCLSISR